MNIKVESTSSKITLTALIIGGVLALTILNWSFVPDATNFEASATLGTETTPAFGRKDELPIHCGGSADAESCLAGQRLRKATQAALWLGNSQVHEVNQWHPGETSASPLLFESLRSHGLDLLTFSLGNASLQEHYVMFEYMLQRMPIKLLILPVVFDDTREEGLRPDVADFAKDEAVALSLSKTAIGRRLASSARSGAKTEMTLTEDVVGLTGDLQGRVEKNLNIWLGDHSRLWQLRPEIRGWLFIGLYRLRNYVFGINPETVRKIIPGRYRDNIAALNAILDESRRRDIRVLVYVVPLRGGVKIPYEVKEYAAFKSEVELLAGNYGASFKNLEFLVPDDLWGTKASTGLTQGEELDFMHFRYGGHKLLAQQIYQSVLEVTGKRNIKGRP